MKPRMLRPDAGRLRPWLGADDVDLLNLHGDYDYLGHGYYASLDAELAGLRVLPTTGEALDAYVTPIMLEKVRQAGLGVAEWRIVTERFPEPPFHASPIHPFSRKAELILDADALVARRRGLTYAGKYAVLCQRLPPDARLDTVRVVAGHTGSPGRSALARDAFRALRIPLMRLRVIVAADASLLAGVDPLPFDTLTDEERAHLDTLGSWEEP